MGKILALGTDFYHEFEMRKTRSKLNFGIVRLHMTSALDYTLILKQRNVVLLLYFRSSHVFRIQNRQQSSYDIMHTAKKSVLAGKKGATTTTTKTIHGLNELCTSMRNRIVKYKKIRDRPLRSILIYTLNIYDLMAFFLCWYSLFIQPIYFPVEWIKISWCCSTSHNMSEEEKKEESEWIVLLPRKDPNIIFHLNAFQSEHNRIEMIRNSIVDSILFEFDC